MEKERNVFSNYFGETYFAKKYQRLYLNVIINKTTPLIVIYANSVTSAYSIEQSCGFKLTKYYKFVFSLETIKHDCLVTHNYHRFQHGASELTWSPILAVEALHWAEKLIRTGSIQSSDTSGRGENIAISSDRAFDVKAAIESWYKEERDYKYSSPAFSSLTRNFSQMIWKECKEVGMALARSDDGNLVVVVAKYYPAGNTVGMFQENVLPKSQRGEDMSS